MVSVDMSHEHIVMLDCGLEWSDHDTRHMVELSQAHQGKLLIVDVSRLTLDVGFSLVAARIALPYAGVVCIVGDLERKLKIELMQRLILMPCPLVTVYTREELPAALRALNAFVPSTRAIH